MVTGAIGLSCLASALLFALMPRRAPDTVQLPARKPLGQAIAVRDFVVGLMLLAPPTQRAALALRAASDGLDTTLMVSEVVRGRRSIAVASLPILGGATLCALSLGLRARLES